MYRSSCLIILLILFFTGNSFTQPINSLRERILEIISTKNAVIGVSIAGSNKLDTLSINGNDHFPMQSVFKLHIALAILSEIDAGKFSFQQKIKINKEDLLPDLYSPIREKYPAGISLTMAEILQYMISESDNVACEILLKLIGGAQTVGNYFTKNHCKDVSIKINEKQQQDNWNLQFQNWTTPNAANEVLSTFYNNSNKLLSKKSYDFIWKAMKATETGKARLKGLLPKGTVVAHKTGSSGINKEGLTAAVNDIGIVFLPGGKYFFISVFVTMSKEDLASNEKIIADIAKAACDYFTIVTK